MKRWIFSAAVLMSCAAPAVVVRPEAMIGSGTSIMFSKDGSKANILMLAATTNPDAVAFNDLLSMQPLDENGKAVKRFQFASSSGERLLSLACPFSKIVPDTGSCTIVIYASSAATFEAASKRLRLRLSDQDAARLGKEFHLDRASASGLLFESSDKKLRLLAEGIQDGVPNQFEINYGH